jgi:hypothetical protein
MICSKRFPKSFQDETTFPDNGYPLYCRRRSAAEKQNNFLYCAKPHGRVGAEFVMDSRWVVPYNPYFTKKYKAHKNFEVCIGVKAIKYINKYVYKVSGRTALVIEDTQDEIKNYLHSKYIGPSETVWNLFQFKTHEEDLTVISLQVHLPGQQAVYFPSEASTAEIARILERNMTTLMAFFAYNARNEDGRQHLYQEFPQHFIFDERRKKMAPSLVRFCHWQDVPLQSYRRREVLHSPFVD